MFAELVARQLFAPPGAIATQTRHLLAQAAASHARLLGSIGRRGRGRLRTLCQAIGTYLRSPAPATEKRFFLGDPQFIEALHALAPSSEDLAGWDATVAPGCCQVPAQRLADVGRGRLGNAVAAVMLRGSRDWHGQIELATDDYGRLHLPFCDWTLVLVDQQSDQRDLFAHRRLLLDLDHRQARLSLPDGANGPVLQMARGTFDAMFVDNRDAACADDVRFGGGSPRPRLERAARLGNTRIRFEPIGADAPAARAETTGAIVGALLAAIEQNAPCVHDQFCQCIRTIHGFDLPPYGSGQIASFSVPTSPGVIGFNVQYSAGGEPRVSPYCFMWLGHELGHTLNYLIDDVAYTHGWRFVENPGEWTPELPRYGRRLKVRTLMQVPYVHLFEWWLLVLFAERGFAGLPWRGFDDAVEVGEDLRREIDEAFELIDQHAWLTPVGRAVVARLRQMVAEVRFHWRRVAPRAAGRAGA